ncbi:Phosphoribosylglycinamide synthetase, ATP-grasp (A) domain-containing protein [Oleidesulfovibrio alaskensis G20]|jgi:biotin carboxylase|uniref:Phosphoribosylglycinamide synthetase, ATP-grasp (A) domain-containing protein n=1 Tax=Oleidesulfovibrio alaskensis (strain ATCC BAA-1058 / DSM 17464 / G20) TaxID=207559 RepID=Q316C7_OLEA2|nr:ATP-grasp domain-containing protein [Oleidesulfovibrio alaskensis]ABB37219.1 Phosphoribosylglycinamide synthetase, ATP-grasp (A) domain-containing protein [Oleidesulfovibrio alaskensis G20]MBG0772595.1 ATP-grasp domain-containing protein [Oleidesulfovibrio alaskensis]
MKPCILIVGAGPNQLPAIEKALERGYEVAATDMNPQAPGLRKATYAGIADTRSPQQTVAFALSLHDRRPLNGVMTIASESAVTVAAVAEALGLPGTGTAAAMKATNKVLRQEAFAAAGVPAPLYARAQNAAQACAAAQRLGWPVVVKPADSAGARGVRKVPHPDAMDDAVAEIRRISQRPEFLVEEFLTGTEHSIEGIVLDGRIHWTGFSDRNYDRKELYPPYFLEDGDTLPTILAPQTLAAVHRAADMAVRALGITCGPVKGDILVDAAGPRVLEMAARLSGDYFCSETVPLHNGVRLLDMVMDQALGLPVDSARLIPDRCNGVALRYVWPRPGRVTAVTGLEEARSMPGVYAVRFEPHWQNLTTGTVISPATCMGERVASVMATGDTRQQAVSRAEAAVRCIRIETEPV